MPPALDDASERSCPELVDLMDATSLDAVGNAVEILRAIAQIEEDLCQNIRLSGSIRTLLTSGFGFEGEHHCDPEGEASSACHR